MKKRYIYNELPDDLKTNYVGEFQFPQFKAKVDELWGEIETYGREKRWTRRRYEDDFRDIITCLLDNQLNDYQKEKTGYMSRETGETRKTHTEEEIVREINTLNAYRSLFAWKEEIYVSENIEIGCPDSYESQSDQEGLTKEDVKDFLSGKKELVDFKDETHSETIWRAINDGEIDFDVLGTFGKKGGVKVRNLTFRSSSLPFELKRNPKNINLQTN